MKIIEIITEQEADTQPVAAPVTATPAAPAKKFQSYDTLQKDPDALVTTWAPRLDQLQSRCNSMMARLIKAAGPKYAGKLAGTTISVRSFDQYLQATPEDRKITIDITVFWDAPDATLAVAIGHELGHIALGHVGTPTPQQSRKDEFSADDFGIRLAKTLGYNTAELFNFMYNKEEYDLNVLMGKINNNSTHPPFDQRINRAKKSGFKLSKGGQQQIDALQQHLAWRIVGVKADADSVALAHVFTSFML